MYRILGSAVVAIAKIPRPIGNIAGGSVRETYLQKVRAIVVPCHRCCTFYQPEHDRISTGGVLRGRDRYIVCLSIYKIVRAYKIPTATSNCLINVFGVRCSFALNRKRCRIRSARSHSMPLVYLVLAGFRTGKMPGKRCIALTPDRVRIKWANPIRLTPGA